MEKIVNKRDRFFLKYIINPSFIDSGVRIEMQCKSFADWPINIRQGHPTTVFGEISVRSPLEWLKFSGAQEQLKISKMFRGDCLLGSEFRDLCGLFT